MKLLEFTHVNYNTPIFIVATQLVYFYFSTQHNCVMLVGPGGTMIGVKESMEAVRAKVQSP
jgi:hypothetical protein